ncbi:MAG: hypothetical protein B7X99_15725 [Rhizobiales bacterium 17-65-6]|jgi:hypothetical protein|nr:MAG: hypothetical protein B7Y65_04430 [Azorhizobium sp. 35-67-15]OYY61122.1 MAG: hypothetical protein B7Y61_22920 [Rhizobiales bacterium 35-66-30]OYZ92996.1 MAG: hypothetical protein B7X99_15725 [Rhizobiales bacterium 17-65-6]OZA92061.1 MAG: hypothetical protein B7X67_29545 [Rhizobiales bacterium 39-66-18]HQS11413.1 hypothetical protein [Xanthobacteraceae bacterium]
MWAIAVILLSALSGPEAHVVTKAGLFTSEDSCKAGLAAGVPARLEGEAVQQFKDGYRRFVCVRVGGADLFQRAK